MKASAANTDSHDSETILRIVLARWHECGLRHFEAEWTVQSGTRSRLVAVQHMVA